MGRPGPGPVGRLPTHAVGLCRGLGACSLPALAPPKPAVTPHFQTASGATLHSLRSFRALWHWQTHSRRTRPPPHPARLRDCQHHRPTLGHTLQPHHDLDRHHPPGATKNGIYIYSGRQRLTPLRVSLMVCKMARKLLKINLLMSQKMTILYMDFNTFCYETTTSRLADLG